MYRGPLLSQVPWRTACSHFFFEGSASLDPRSSIVFPGSPPPPLTAHRENHSHLNEAARGALWEGEGGCSLPICLNVHMHAATAPYTQAGGWGGGGAAWPTRPEQLIQQAQRQHQQRVYSSARAQAHTQTHTSTHTHTDGGVHSHVNCMCLREMYIDSNVGSVCLYIYVYIYIVCVYGHCQGVCVRASTQSLTDLLHSFLSPSLSLLFSDIAEDRCWKAGGSLF